MVTEQDSGSYFSIVRGEEGPCGSGSSGSTTMLISLRTRGRFSSEVRFREAAVMVKVEERKIQPRWEGGEGQGFLRKRVE